MGNKERYSKSFNYLKSHNIRDDTLSVNLGDDMKVRVVLTEKAIFNPDEVLEAIRTVARISNEKYEERFGMYTMDLDFPSEISLVRGVDGVQFCESEDSLVSFR